MRDETVARSYAATLLELAQRHEGLDTYGAGIEMVAHLIDENPKFRLFLETPRIADADKKAVLRRALDGQLPKELVNFVLITIDKRRQRLLRDISREFQAMVDEHEGRAHVEVTVARSMDEATQEMLTTRLSKLLAKQAIAHMRLRPEIIGGVVVRAGDTIYDGSVRRQLDSMRHHMMNAAL